MNQSQIAKINRIKNELAKARSHVTELELDRARLMHELKKDRYTYRVIAELFGLRGTSAVVNAIRRVTAK